MKKSSIKHYALVPAKARSSRCRNKNWRKFVSGHNLVTYSVSIIPQEIFDMIILSTDKSGIGPMKNIVIHRRPERLAMVKSSVSNLISVIIDEYDLDREGYLWLLNPTSPFRNKKDFFKIRRTLIEKEPPSIVSGARINPFIWKDSKPLFDTGYPRKNVQDFAVEYYVENGQFIVFKVGDFLKTKTWYFGNTLLFKQSGLRAMVDIDTEEDFLEAQELYEKE